MPRGFGIVPEHDFVRLVHPEGADVAVIEYRERVRPLVKVGAAIRRFLAEQPQLACALPDCVERTITAEGEYAAVATLPGEAQQIDLGFVFGDDFYAQVTSVCFRSEHFDAMTHQVRALVFDDTHLLGVRRRRFEYAPPRGWQPIVRGFITDWLAPEYPRDFVRLTAYPAFPRVITSRKLPAEMRPVAPIHTSSGLVGEIGEAVLPLGAKRCAVLHDERYVYTLEATAREPAQLERHRDEIDEVFASAQPIPAPREHLHDADFAAQGHWID